MNPAAKLLLLIVVYAVGVLMGVRLNSGQVARTQLQEQQQAARERIRQQELAAPKALAQAEAVRSLNTQLGAAHEEIARLSGRACLDGSTVGMLNATGVPGGSPAAEPAPAPAAAAAGTGLRFATDRDVAGYIAMCRTRYAEVAGQLDRVLDIEDARFPPPPQGTP